MLSTIPKRALACILWATTAGAGAGLAQEPEDQLKAAVVLSFLRYGDWNAALAPDGSVTVGVLGRASFADTLRKSLEGKTANDHPVHVVDLKTMAVPAGYAIVYFAEDKELDTKAALQNAAAHVLTIGESKDFLDWGGAVRLFVLDGHIAFEFSLATLARCGVNISSRLLRFGQIRNPKKGDRL